MNKKLQRAMENVDNYERVILREGNFTVCLLMSRGKIASFGFAKCNPNYDEPDEERGMNIAVSRAMKKLINKRRR